jgi:PAS domain S-box-containing protein
MIEYIGKQTKVNGQLLEEITGRERSEEQFRKLTCAVEQSPTTVVITDIKGNIEYVNPKFTRLTGYTFKEAIGQNPSILKSGKTPPEEYKRLWEFITSGKEWHGEFCNKKKNGELYWESASISPIRNAEGVITHFVGIKEDITERKKMEEMLQEQKKVLEQKNIALREVLEQVELGKEEIKNNVTANVENLLLPVIQKLMLKKESCKYVQLLQKNLQELTSSFGVKLIDKKAKLTSREIEICNMVKNGLTSKEIAGLLNTSLRTTEKHRANIRKKLCISNNKNLNLNLNSFLQTL